jgi:hypothetical protein
VQSVRKAVGKDRVYAGPRRQDLESRDSLRSRIAAVRGGDVAADLRGGTPNYSEPEHR